MPDELKVCIDFMGQQYPQGDDPVLVERDHACFDCGQTHDIEKCPKCGGWIELGFGLMGGGFGGYKFCTGEGCSWFWKECLCYRCEGVIEHGSDTEHPGVCVGCTEHQTHEGG